MDLIARGRRIVQKEAEALSALADSIGDSFDRAVRRLLACEGRIVLTGVGKSGNIGHKIAATFNSTGAVAVVLHSQNALHGDLGLLADGDAVVALSYSGETAELLDLLPHIVVAEQVGPRSRRALALLC